MYEVVAASTGTGLSEARAVANAVDMAVHSGLGSGPGSVVVP